MNDKATLGPTAEAVRRAQLIVGKDPEVCNRPMMQHEQLSESIDSLQYVTDRLVRLRILIQEGGERDREFPKTALSDHPPLSLQNLLNNGASRINEYRNEQEEILDSIEALLFS